MQNRARVSDESSDKFFNVQVFDLKWCGRNEIKVPLETEQTKTDGPETRKIYYMQNYNLTIIKQSNKYTTNTFKK